ncbi:MAG: hypothetical protein CMF94_00310 [Candidatus Marinimicrobia bacterium]|nr:hypothetical protein [Candidatus Neomarinimicrobiota bacterium]
MKLLKIYFTFITFSWLFAQQSSILPAQKKAISSLATSYGFSAENLDDYLVQNFGTGLENLTRVQGAEVIKAFQAKNIPKSFLKKQEAKKSASFIEPGMKKQFHFRDGSVRDGEILTVKDNMATLKTSSGSFTIPTSEFLDETAEIKNKKGELFNGVVLGETEEEFVLRTQYGDAVIQKRDISSMKRYYGGVLDKQTENKRQFYQGQAQLISIFLDPTAFPLTANTFYVSGLSIGYGLTDRFMMRSVFGSNFTGDLNLHAKMRFYHKKTASKEVAASWGAAIHRRYPATAITGKYSQAIDVFDGLDTDSTSAKRVGSLNEMNGEEGLPEVDIKDVTKKSGRHLYGHAFVVFSSRSTNPSGRGKVGWSAGAKVSNAFMSRNNLINSSINVGNKNYRLEWNKNAKYKIPYRIWAGIEYDLRKDLKFLAIAWVDNGYKTMSIRNTARDYFGSDDTAIFSIDSPRGNPSLIDFDFGIQYAVSETFRLGIHFQQPYLDFYWEFFEF